MFIRTIFQSKVLPHFGDLSKYGAVTPNLMIGFSESHKYKNLYRRVASIKNGDKHVNLMVATSGVMSLRIKGQLYPLDDMFKYPYRFNFSLQGAPAGASILAISAKDGMLEWGYGCRIPHYNAREANMSPLIAPYVRLCKRTKRG